MPATVTVEPYEILLRMNATGITGAHYKEITVFRNSAGVIIGAQEGDPQAVSLVEGASGLTLNGVMGIAMGPAMMTIETQHSQIVALQDQIDALQAQVSDLTDQLTMCQSQSLAAPTESQSDGEPLPESK